jgi:O-antigen/teichoic acid export membrane protein
MTRVLSALTAWHHRLQSRFGALTWNSLILFVFLRIGDVGNVLYQLILGRHLSGLDFGAVQPVVSVIGILGIPIAIVYNTGTKSISRLLAMDRKGQCAALTGDLMKLALVGSLVSALVLFLLADYVLLRLHLDGRVYTWMLIGLIVLAWWRPLAQALIRGSRRFWLIALPSITDPVLMIGLTLLFGVALGWGLPGALAVRVLATAVSTVVIMVSVRSILKAPRSTYREEIEVMKPMLIPMAVFTTSNAFLLYFDPLLVRNFMFVESAGYGAIVTLGRIPLWLINPIIFVVFPLVAADHAKGASIARLYRQGVGLGLAIAALAAAFFYFASAPLIEFWNPHFSPYAPFVWLYALAMGIDAVVQIIANVEMARHRYRFLVHYVIPTIIMCGGLYGIRDTLTLDELLRILVSTRLIILLGVFLSSRLNRAAH